MKKYSIHEWTEKQRSLWLAEVRPLKLLIFNYKEEAEKFSKVNLEPDIKHTGRDCGV